MVSTFHSFLFSNSSFRDFKVFIQFLNPLVKPVPAIVGQRRGTPWPGHKSVVRPFLKINQ